MLEQKFDNGSCQSFNALVCPLNKNFDMILGKPWLNTVKAIYNHYKKQIEVTTGKGKCTLTAEKESQSKSSCAAKINVITFEQLKGIKEDVAEYYFCKVTPADDTGLADITEDIASKILKKEYADIISNGEMNADSEARNAKSRFKLEKHKITLMDGATPVKKSPYRMSPRELEEVSKQLKTLTEKGYIKPSSSPWSSPVVFARKKDGSLRMCVDYRALNRLTIPESYPIPRIDDNIDRLGSSHIYSIVDLESGFHQIMMDDSSEEKTAFSTRYGQFQFTVMPFGLRNAPTTFQRVMNAVLSDLIDECCVVYIDDILIFFEDRELHEQHIRKVMNRLREFGLVCNGKKSKFFQSEVKYLGFVIGHNSIKADPEKTRVVSEWSTPKSVTEVRSFLGLLNYYRRLIHNFTHKALPLLNLTKKDVPFIWNNDCEKSFLELKEALLSAPVLKMPNFELPFFVWPDASQEAVGGILTQLYDGHHHPIAFLSSKLSAAERKYSTTERELLAILTCLRRWKCYVDGKDTTVFTDHKPLTWSRGLKNPKPRVYGWIEELEYYSPSIRYVVGSKQPADALSRLKNDETIASVSESNAPSTIFVSNISNTNDRFTRHAEKAGGADLFCKTSNSINDDICYSMLMNSELSEEEEYETSLGSNWPEMVGKFLFNDPSWSSNLSINQQRFIKMQAPNFKFYQNKLHRKVVYNEQEILVPYLAESHRRQEVEKYHLVLGHLAKDSVFGVLRARYWWPKMEDYIKIVISECQSCDLYRLDSNRPLAPLHPLPPAPLPFQRWHIDFLQDLPRTVAGYDNIALFRSESQRKKSIQRYGDKNNIRETKFKIGEYVKRKNHTKTKFQTQFHGPFIVIETGPNDTYKIMYPNGKVYESLVHHDDLASYSSPETDVYHTPTGVHDANEVAEVEETSI